jgi:hypothetical protein
MSLLVPADTKELTVTARWGDYKLQQPDDGHGAGAQWSRTPREETLTLAIPERTKQPVEKEVPKSNGLKVVLLSGPSSPLALMAGCPGEPVRFRSFS